MIEGLQSFQNVFKIPELKRRVLITLGLLAAYRLGAHVPTPGIDGSALAEFFNQMQGTLLGMVDLFSGGNLRRLTVFALGIMPYISASIILQLLTVVIPALETPEMCRELVQRLQQHTPFSAGQALRQLALQLAGQGHHALVHPGTSSRQTQQPTATILGILCLPQQSARDQAGSGATDLDLVHGRGLADRAGRQRTKPADHRQRRHHFA